MYNSNFELLLLIVTIFTICLQLYVLFLVQYKTTGTMRDYKFFLVVLTIWDIAFSTLLGIFLQPDPMADSLSAVVRGVSAYFGEYAPLWTICAVVYAGIQVIVSQNHCLLYRYFVLHNNRSIHATFMAPKVKFLYILQAQVAGFVLSVIFYRTLVEPDEISSRISTDLPHMLPSLHAGERFIFIDAHSKLAKWFFATLLSLFVVSETACFVLIYKTLAELKQKSSGFSKLTYKLHFQFTLLLGSQLLTPLIFIFGPVSAYIVTTLFGKTPTQFAMEIGLMFLAFYGGANSILTICFIGPYRAHAFNLLIRSWLRPLVTLIGIRPKWLTERRQSTIQSVIPSTQHATRRLSQLPRLRSGSVYVEPFKESGYF